MLSFMPVIGPQDEDVYQNCIGPQDEAYNA